jgi:predicted RNA-binding Zn ribbon-like protein
MHLSLRYDVPKRLALLYDFLNSIDRRRYVERATPHNGGDELTTPVEFRAWLSERSFPTRQAAGTHSDALRLRDAIRALLKLPPTRRVGTPEARDFDRAAAAFPLAVVVKEGSLELRPTHHSGAIGGVLAELYKLSVTGDLDRLRVCASDECEWVFFDRSKPGNRKWCSSDRCGNREKTRAYRMRQLGKR